MGLSVTGERKRERESGNVKVNAENELDELSRLFLLLSSCFSFFGNTELKDPSPVVVNDVKVRRK